MREIELRERIDRDLSRFLLDDCMNNYYSEDEIMNFIKKYRDNKEIILNDIINDLSGLDDDMKFDDYLDIDKFEIIDIINQ